MTDTNDMSSIDDMRHMEDPGFILARRPKAETVAEYKASIEQRVALTWGCYKVGVTLRELNQRYCQLGIRFGISPAVAAQLLAREDRLETYRYRGSLILFPPNFAVGMNPETMVTDIKTICRETLGK